MGSDKSDTGQTGLVGSDKSDTGQTELVGLNRSDIQRQVGVQRQVGHRPDRISVKMDMGLVEEVSLRKGLLHSTLITRIIVSVISPGFQLICYLLRPCKVL